MVEHSPKILGSEKKPPPPPPPPHLARARAHALTHNGDEDLIVRETVSKYCFHQSFVEQV